MFTITKRFEFSAAHRLYLDAAHPCSRLHGHNYVVELVLQSFHLNGASMVYDYRKLDAFKKWIDRELDHRNLNDVVPGDTTAENLALYIYDEWSERIDQLVAVRVSETPKTWAEYRPG